MLIEAYTEDGKQCAWTLGDMEEMKRKAHDDEVKREEFKIYYEKNFPKIVGMWEYQSTRAGKPFKCYDGGNGSTEEMIAHYGLVCFLLNLHHSPIWKEV